MANPTYHPDQIKTSFGKPAVSPMFTVGLGPAVYFYSHDAAPGLIKIGYTSDLDRRSGELHNDVMKTALPNRYEILLYDKRVGMYELVLPTADKRAEGWIHGLLAAARIDGPWGREWFHAPPVRLWIGALVNGGGWGDD